MVDFPKAFLGSRRNKMDEVIIDLAEEEEKNDRGTRRVTARCLSHRSGNRERMLISESSGSNLRPPRLDRSIYAQALDSMCYEQIREIIVKNAPASRPFPPLSLSLHPRHLASCSRKISLRLDSIAEFCPSIEETEGRLYERS